MRMKTTSWRRNYIRRSFVCHAPRTEPSLIISAHQQEALKASELRYRRLFEAARDGILILNAHTSKIADSNPSLSELLGYSREELLGKELADLGRVEDRQAAQQKMAQLQRDGSLRYADLPLLFKSGQARSVEVVGSVYAEGERSVIQCSIRDTSARRSPHTANTDAELHYRSLADAILQPVWTALPDGTLDYFNERWYEYTGMALQHRHGCMEGDPPR